MEQRPPLPKHALLEYKLRLIGDVINDGDKPPTLAVNMFKNQPRITVYTNVPNDDNYGQIAAPMDSVTFYSFLEKMYEVIEGASDVQYQIVNKTGPIKEQRNLSTTIFGKDKEGRVYISVIAQNRPRIKFIFKPTTYHVFKNKEGEDLNEADVSVMFAKGWVKLMVEMVSGVLTKHYEQRDYNNNNQQGGGKNFNQSGYGNKDYSNAGYKQGGERPSNLPKVEIDEDDLTF